MGKSFHPAGRGDKEGYSTRTRLRMRGHCLPASWGSPSIGGDGVVYANFQSGWLYAIKDVNGDGIIDNETEVVAFETEAASQGGISFAPGMMAVTTCDSLY